MNFILFMSLFMVSLAHAQSNPREALLRGVRTIDCEGVPGAVLYGGDAAFALVLGASDKSALPVAVAALYGKGRVVALGHPGFYSAKACEKGDTAQFMANALTWTGQGRSTIAVFQNHDFAQYLQSKGYAAVELKDWDRLTADVGVLVAYPDAIPEKELERVRTFMMQGGGLLASGIGWGWLQVSGGKSLVTDNRFNTLLKPAGLLITADVSGRTGTNGYTVGEIPRGVSITEAAALAQQGGALDRATLRQINLTLCSAKAVLADSDTSLCAQALAPILAKQKGIRLSEKEPLTEQHIAERLALIVEGREWLAHPKQRWPASPAASAYPGVVASQVQRISRDVKLDLSIPRWHSTGCYLSAGDPLTIELPAGAEKIGLKVRIGSTTCNVTHHEKWVRAPRVDVEIPLTEAVTTFSTPYGGLVYLIVPDQPKTQATSVACCLRGVVPAGWFKVGRDALMNWPAIKRAPAPWVEIASDKVILTVPREVVQNVDNPIALMAFWDQVADADAQLTAIPAIRRSPERFVSDVELCVGWMHAGYPIMIPVVTAKELVDLPTLRKEGDWGFFHELGHNHQNRDWTFEGTGEVTVNFFTLYNMEKLCGLTPRQTRMKNEATQAYQKWLQQGKPYAVWCHDPFLALELFVRIQQAYGWTTFEKLFKEYRTLSEAERPKNDQEKRDQWCTRLSALTRENIAAVFASWNIPVSDAAQKFCATYPLPKDQRLMAR